MRLLPGATGEAEAVALWHELEELLRLDELWEQHRETALVDWFVDSEYAVALMPQGHLPKRPAPVIRTLLDEMRERLLARLVFQWGIDTVRRLPETGVLGFSLRAEPSWGLSEHSLVLGRSRAVLVGKMPRRWRFAWDRQGIRLSTTGVRLTAHWGGAWQIHAPRHTVELLPKAGPWPLRPVVAPSRRPLDAAGECRRIERARAVLAQAWPEGARTVDEFTSVLIPVDQPEVVSYSFAPVPGWSYLNLFDRDFIDLIDDLVHENAHHHLNHLLAERPFLRPIRDEPLLYYSPWREALRPLRGILHSVFTFAAGAELFRRLWAQRQQFTDSEQRKIAARCLEETLQVRYSLVDLDHATRTGRLTTAGQTLVAAIARQNRGFDRTAPPLWRAVRDTRWERRLRQLDAVLGERDALRRRMG